MITRAAVFPMTIWSGLIGGLLAVTAARTTTGLTVDYWLLTISVVGLVLAHAANNMINDYFDSSGGVDTPGYVRALYAPHPILSGWVTRRQLAAAILAVNVIDAGLMLYLTAVRGPLILVFALAGLFISVFYVAPPIRLKHHGLGEPGVFLVWGPLMVGGTFLAATGTIPGWVLLVSVPYALLVTSVLFGKHIDKIEADAAPHLRTWQDGWRHLSFLLIYSPKWLFFYPGLFLLALGIFAAFALLPGPVLMGNVAFDIHTFTVACIAVLVGTQAMSFGAVAFRFATVHKLVPPSHRFSGILTKLTLEWILVLSAVVFLSGFAGVIWCLLQWASTGFGPLEYSALLRILILSLTAIAIGVQLTLTGFLSAIVEIPVR